jgi:hypothetical protein
VDEGSDEDKGWDDDKDRDMRKRIYLVSKLLQRFKI